MCRPESRVALAWEDRGQWEPVKINAIDLALTVITSKPLMA